MIFCLTVWADVLSDRIEAATTVVAVYGCDGKSRYIGVGDIFADCYINTITGLCNLAVCLIIVDPPCTKCYMQDIVSLTYLLNDK